jgi:ADP-ribosylarginine hydrolase
MLHGGDSDSTGTIAAAWYGALFGFENVFNKNFENC